MTRKETNTLCRCGCGGISKTGIFMKGHDQKLLHKLRKMAGGYDELEQAVIEYKNTQLSPASGGSN